jgi:endonuclease/exonuclease/phosphatase family metal-dependent hydrolase
VRVPGAGAGTWPDVTSEDLAAASDHLPVVVDLLLGSAG